MTNRPLPVNRRVLLAGLAGGLLAPVVASAAQAQARPSTLALQLRTETIAWRPGSDGEVWNLASPGFDDVWRFKRGDGIEVGWENQLAVQAVLNWHGIDGVAGAEPLLGQPALAAGAKASFRLPLRQAGTYFSDARLLGDGQAHPVRARAMVVQETEPVVVDRDEVLLIEDFRLRPDGSAVAPGSDAKDAATLYTVNGKPGVDIAAQQNERLRLRIINGCQRNAIALKIADHNVWVMAIDSQPSEPFLARNGQLVLVPGTRIDAFVDATTAPGSTSAIVLHDGKAPYPIARLLTSTGPMLRSKPLTPATALPSNGLPAILDLKNGLRFDIALAPPADWIKPPAMTATVAPAFHAKAGRTVVLALKNAGSMPVAFHLHGHHMRLLDRLDDGWKPFWLDTLMIDAGQTQRVAFAAEHTGRWLMEAMAVDWAAPRLVRWYAVD